VTSKLLFTNQSLPNFHIEINGNGAKVWVSLNIEPAMKKFLYSENVFKADKLWVYALRKQLTVVNTVEINKAYEELLNKAMINCREAKQKVLQSQIDNLKILQK
jgi:hypothetical protein